ncbi:hypothetical protein B0H14DRAFT_3485062 [Mycena olivaceomarginata]|nr:hypothetical protein B0H14DRAFT_3485062 [Mycena olivaceomarginata]
MDPVVELGLRAAPGPLPPPQPKRSSQHVAAANATGQVQATDSGKGGVTPDVPVGVSSAEDESMPAQEDEPMPMQASSTPGSQAQAAVSGCDGATTAGVPLAANSTEDEGALASAHGATGAIAEAQGPAGGAAGGAEARGFTDRATSSPTITGVGLALVDVSSSEKHAKVLAHFRSGIGLPAWVAVVDTWCTLEVATGLLVPGKVLPPHGRPEAVSRWVQRAHNDQQIPASLEEDDQWDAFYDKVVKWWIAVNPAWQKEGVTGPASFAEHGLKQESGGDLGGLLVGLNGLTSVVACLWWWYQLAGVVEGAPVWKKLVGDVTWVLTEKFRAIGRKRVGRPSGEEPAGKRARRE